MTPEQSLALWAQKARAVRARCDALCSALMAMGAAPELLGPASYTEGGAGPQGPQGAAGSAGAQGAAGSAGGAGPQGPQGAAGSAGGAGTQGPQGAAGSAGGAGPQGPQGAAGSAGAQGAAGLGLFFQWACVAAPAIASARYMVCTGGAVSATEAQGQWLVGADCTLTYLRVRANAALATNSVTVMVRKNGVNTALTVTLAGAGTSGAITGQSVAFAAGDRVSLSLTQSSTEAQAAWNFRAVVG